MIVERKRHIAKTISYRIVSTLIGFGLMWLISGSVKVGAAFGIAEFYLHERIWYKWIRYGLKNPDYIDAIIDDGGINKK